jgi:hypothetical protein
MRKGDVMIRLCLFCFALGALPALAQISGVVINATTEKPQAGVTVNLVHPGQGGMQTLATVKTDADGKFKIDHEVPPPPALLQASYQDVQYNLIMQPGAPSQGVRLSVYNATSQASSASLSKQHLVVLEPLDDGIHVAETFLMQNTGKTTFQDPVKGSVQIYLPKEAQGNAKVTVDAPSGMPITRAPEKTSEPDVFKVGYPIKPGETTYEVAYTLPPSIQFAGKVLGSGQMLVVTPESVKLSGTDLKEDGLKQLGQGGPMARVYEVTAKSGASYELGIEGTGSLQAASGGDSQPSEEDGGPPKERAGPPRIYDRLPWVLGLAFGILGVGGALLYRRGPGPGSSAA